MVTLLIFGIGIGDTAHFLIYRYLRLGSPLICAAFVGDGSAL
jgi:hypothetical protein